MIRGRRPGHDTCVSGKGLRRKDALDSHRIRSPRPQRLYCRNVHSLRFGPGDEIRPQAVDYDQNYMRTDRRLSSLDILFRRRLLNRQTRRSSEQTDDEEQRDEERQRQRGWATGRLGDRAKFSLRPFIFASMRFHSYPSHDYLVCAMRIDSIISRTARSSPTRAARAMMLCPILNSSISDIRATAPTLR